MAPRLKLLWLIVALSTVAANLPRLESVALAAGLDAKGEATAKEASGLYRQGLYEEAAKVFAKLVVDYPDMVIFERSLGACFYYLRKPEPALSNLRNYLVHRQDIPADDRAVVDRWIDEMEKLRAQNAAAVPAAEVPLPVAAPAVPAAVLPAPPPEPVARPLFLAPAPVAGLPFPAPETPAALDVSAQTAPSESPAESPPVYRRWWFWGSVGAVVAAGAVTAVVLLAGKGGSNVPGTPLGNQGAFQ
jgi:hypothetical protein